jgi:hypothetical protein
MTEGRARMSNGTDYQGQQAPYQSLEPVAVKIDFGLTGRQILLALGGLATIITSGISAGYIFLPAKETDVQALRVVVEKVSTDMVRVTTAIEGLTAAVDRIQQQPPRVIERVITRRVPSQAAP